MPEAGGLHLREVAVFLAAAGIVIPIVSRLKISPVLGFLAIGVVLGPNGLGRIAPGNDWLDAIRIGDVEGVHALAEFGVIFLLFMIGLDLSSERLWAMRRLVFGLGAAQVVTTGAVFAAVAAAFGLGGPAAIVVGGCLALSSTAMVTGILVERRRLAMPVGRAMFAILLFQDLAVVPILVAIGALGGGGEQPLALALLIALGQAALAIAAILGLGRFVVRPLFRIAAAARSRDLLTAAALFIVLATAMLTEAVGLSMALGAFLAGLLFSDTEFRHQIEVDLDPVRGLLLGVFFMSVGMELDVATVLEAPLTVAGLTIGVFVLKAAVVGGLVLVCGLGRGLAAEAGPTLGQVGEFAFVGLTLAVSNGVLPAEVGQRLLVVAGLSMAVTPLVASGAERLGRFVARKDASRQLGAPDDGETLAGHVVIAGFGRVGRMLGEILDSQRAPFVAFDLDAGTVAARREAGDPVFFGDASRPEILAHAGIVRANAVVVTMDDPQAVERIVRAIRLQHLDVPLIVRARDSGQAARLLRLGADEVIPEAVEASLTLGEATLRSLGLPMDAARQVIADRRESERLLLERARPGDGPRQ